jgi:bacillithiol biosynthesis cysteine-adding enzyme BshC
MQIEEISRANSNCFSDMELSLSENQNKLEGFLNRTFDLENFEAQIIEKSNAFSPKQRSILCDGLKIQYANCSLTPSVQDSLKKLELHNTFTVTTGHQLSLMTGPLYFIVKILHVIKQAEELSLIFPAHNFVPVYWMASEDHDFEEIQSISLFNQLVTWESDAKGAVGRFPLDGLSKVKEQIASFYQNHPDSDVFKALDSLEAPTYGQAFFKLIHWLFGDKGLVVLDGDQRLFKQSFMPFLKKEIESSFSFNAVQETTLKLEGIGIKPQVFPREINLFYLQNNSRERIIRENDGFQLGNNLVSKEQLLKMIEENPESFSPNVILRPLYQEVLLPNICYVGGVGELKYWLQLKRVFEVAVIPFPMIQTRSSVLFIDAPSNLKIQNLGLDSSDFFEDKKSIISKYLQKHEAESIDYSALNLGFENLKNQIIEKAIEIDPQLKSSATAELVRMEKSFIAAMANMDRAVKTKHDKALKQIDQLKEKLFPKGKLQERSLNLLQICPEGDLKNKIDVIYQAINPFSSNIKIIIETK